MSPCQGPRPSPPAAGLLPPPQPSQVGHGHPLPTAGTPKGPGSAPQSSCGHHSVPQHVPRTPCPPPHGDQPESGVPPAQSTTGCEHRPCVTASPWAPWGAPQLGPPLEHRCHPFGLSPSHRGQFIAWGTLCQTSQKKTRSSHQGDAAPHGCVPPPPGCLPSFCHRGLAAGGQVALGTRWHRPCPAASKCPAATGDPPSSPPLDHFGQSGEKS